MAEILNVLCLEDSPRDAELIRELLFDSGYQLNMDCTAEEKEFVSFLRSAKYDIILSDFKLPAFDAFAALKWSVEICPDIPFICVSGTVGEETAIELLKKGAVDYILKDRLIRLPSAIQRAIEESNEKKARLQAETALNESEERFRTLFENSTVGIYRTTPDGKILLANPALVKFLGFSSFEELSTRNLEEGGFEPSYERSHFTEIMNREGVVNGMEAVWTRTDGSKLYVSESAKAIRDQNGKILYYDGIVEDITIRKLAEEKINQQYYTLKCITESSGGPFFSLDKAYRYTSFNKAHSTVMKLIYGADIELGVSLFEYQRVEEDKFKAKANLDRALSGEYVEERAWSGKDSGKLRLFEVTHNPIFNEENEVMGVAVNAKDLTEKELIEVRLKESEELYGKLFHNMLNGFAYCRMLYDNGSPSDFIYLGVNKAFETQTGLKNVTGKKVSEAIPGIQKSDPELIERYGRVASTGNPEVFETYVESMKMWFSISVYSPQKEYFVAVFDVITERKKAEEALHLKNLVFDASIAANSIADIDGKLTEVNDAFLRIWGFAEKKEVIGMPISDFLQYDNEAVAVVTSLSSKGEWEGDYTGKRKDGSNFIAHGLTTNVKDETGKVIGYQSAVIDVTDRKNQEEEISRLNEKLELRVHQRTEQLESANKELEAFSYSVSHDLRAPLRAIHGYTNILLEEYGNKLDDEGKRLCGIVYSSASQMGELIDDLLNFSRIGRTSMTPSLIDMKTMAMNVINELNPKTENRKVKINISKLNKAYGDSALIKLVWTNLISNALKYSSKKEISEISIGSSVRGEMITYHVTDNGVGFDMLYKHKLFGVFQRLHSEREFEGNGVGLAIVRRIIMKHGGSAWAEGQVGKGATFYFSLPAIGDKDMENVNSQKITGEKKQTLKEKPQSTEERQYDTEERQQNTAERQLDTTVRQQNTRERQLDTDEKQQVNEERQLDTDEKQQVNEERQLATEKRQNETEEKQKVTEERQKKKDKRQK